MTRVAGPSAVRSSLAVPVVANEHNIRKLLSANLNNDTKMQWPQFQGEYGGIASRERLHLLRWVTSIRMSLAQIIVACQRMVSEIGALSISTT